MYTEDKNREYVIMTKAGYFYDGYGGFSSEYPDAAKYTKSEANRVSKKLNDRGYEVEIGT